MSCAALLLGLAVSSPPGSALGDWTGAKTATAAFAEFLLRGPDAGDWATEERYDAEPIETKEPTIDIGGALRFNFSSNTWAGDAQIPSSSSFDTFRLDLDGRWAELFFSAQYRFYAGYNMLQHGYIGAELEEESLSVQLGVTQVPFGVLPYASHNFFFSLKYYIGLEDDYDLGVKAATEIGNLGIQVAFFKNDEGNYSGTSRDSSRYSYDLVETRAGDLIGAGIEEARRLKEVNQANGRLTYTFEHAEGFTTELGLSGQIGQTFDRGSQFRSRQWALGGHIDADYEWLNLKLEAGHYDISQDDRAVGDPRLVAMGAYDAPYAVAAKATFLVASVAVEVDVDLWVIETVTFYENYSALLKSEPSFADSHQLVTGALLSAGPIYTYVDWAVGRNHPWLGNQYVNALGRGRPNAPWELRFNVNLGWYF